METKKALETMFADKRAKKQDIPAIMELLKQVNMVHHIGRPDLFRVGTKYTAEELEALLLRLRTGKNILIGSDTGNEALGGYSFVAEPYAIEPTSGGFITAIVPMRYDYAYAVATLEYIAETVGKQMRELLMIE